MFCRSTCFLLKSDIASIYSLREIYSRTSREAADLGLVLKDTETMTTVPTKSARRAAPKHAKPAKAVAPAAETAAAAPVPAVESAPAPQLPPESPVPEISVAAIPVTEPVEAEKGGHKKKKKKEKKEKKAKKEAVLIRFEDAQLAKIDAQAESLGLSRAAWVRMVVAKALGAE